MTDDRMGGVALIAGAAGAIVTMSIHPSGHDLFAPGQFAAMARLAVVAHALALATVPSRSWVRWRCRGEWPPRNGWPWRHS